MTEDAELTAYLDAELPVWLAERRRQLWAGDFIPQTAVRDNVIPLLHLEGSPDEWKYTVAWDGWYRIGSEQKLREKLLRGEFI